MSPSKTGNSQIRSKVRTSSPRSTICLTGDLFRQPKVDDEEEPVTAMIIRHLVLPASTVHRQYQGEFDNIIQQAEFQATTFYRSITRDTAALALHLANRTPELGLDSIAYLESYPTDEWLSKKLQKVVSIFACSAATIMDRIVGRERLNRLTYCPNICVVKSDLWNEWSNVKSRAQRPLAFQKHFNKVEPASDKSNKKTWAAANQKEPLSRTRGLKVFCETENGRVIDLGKLADDTSEDIQSESQAIEVENEGVCSTEIDWNMDGVDLEALLELVTDG
jgi:hypothetical protein